MPSQDAAQQLVSGLPAQAMPIPLAPLPSVGSQAFDPRKSVVSFWVGKGVPLHVAQGISDQTIKESGGDPAAVGDSGTSTGLYQEHADRQKTLLADIENNRAYQEVMGGDPIAAAHWNEIKNAKTREEASSLWQKYFERPAGTGGAANTAGIGAAAGLVRQGYYAAADRANRSAQELISQLGPYEDRIDQSMQRIHAAQDRADKATQAAEQSLANPPKQPEIDGVQHFGGLATMIGILGGFLTKRPLQAGLSAAGAAMEAYNQGDMDKFKIARDQWKCLAVDTPVPIQTGWTTIGDINIGDCLFDENGVPCEVTGVSDVKTGNDCFEICFDDGCLLVADREHLWRTSEGRLLHTWQLVENVDSINICGALQTPAVALPIPPYVLGVWLGDGDSSGATISGHANDIQEIANAITSEGVETGAISVDKRNGVCRLGLLNFRVLLKEAGLYENKHIPPIYLRASAGQRLALLQGLLDTDGSCGAEGQAFFYTSDPRLAHDIFELLVSLGIKAKCYTRPPRFFSKNEINIEGKTPFFFPFQSYDTPLFRLKRKLDRQMGRLYRKRVFARTRRRKIVGVRPVETVPVRCIQVDSPSRLFLAGTSMIPTHNTQTDLMFKLADMSRQRVSQIREDESLGLEERRTAIDLFLRATGQEMLADKIRLQGDDVLLQSQTDMARLQNTAQTDFLKTQIMLDRVEASMRKPIDPKYQQYEAAHEKWRQENPQAVARGQDWPLEVSNPIWQSLQKGAGLTDVPETEIKYWTTVLKNGGSLPPGLSRTAGGSQLVLQIMKNMGSAGDPNEFITNLATKRADANSLNNMTKMADAATSFERTASTNFDLALRLSKDAIPTDWGPWLNKFIETGETQAGNTNVPPYVTAMLTGANEYAKIMSGSTGAQGSTVDSRREAAELFSPYLSAGQIDRVVAVAKADMANRKQSLYGQIDDIKSRLRTEGSQQPTATQGQAKQPVPVPPEHMNDPDGTTYNNGAYVKRGNQMVPQ